MEGLKLPESGETELRVAEALQQDVGKGMVRIDNDLMNEIGANPGDIVEIIGKRTTGAIAGNSYPADVGLKSFVWTDSPDQMQEHP